MCKYWNIYILWRFFYFPVAMKKYGVVIFDSSRSSGVVPCNWIFKKSEDGNTYCYYPPDTWTESRLNRVITTCSDPDTSWQDFRCRHMYSTGFFHFISLFLHDESHEILKKCIQINNVEVRRPFCKILFLVLDVSSTRIGT